MVNDNMEYQLTVIIPTYNEETNIEKIIPAIDHVCKEHNIREEILVVDDNSKDRTKVLVENLQKSMDNLHLLIRYSDNGLSQSLYDGFFHANSDLIQCIDADFSHPPEKIAEFYHLLNDEDFDLVIGSRYIPGGEIKNWPFIRRILSHGAALIGRCLIPIVHDSGSGFFAFNKRVLDGATLTPRGFRMGFEILGKGHWSRVTEIPITFKDRECGESKLKFSIISDFLIQCMHILQFNFIERKSHNIIKSWKMFMMDDASHRQKTHDFEEYDD